jgi:hypothetical protein
VDVLPLARERPRQSIPGWCTYAYEHEQAPELEVLCGGLNSKTPRAAGVWRQGHLLHFGFAPAPTELNEAGQALLVNAISYIARFTEDRPIVSTQGKRIFDRGAVARLVAEPERDLALLEYYVAPSAYATLKGQTRAQVAEWYQKARDYLHADANGQLVVDAEAQTFGVPPASPEFWAKMLAALEQPNPPALARRLWTRYVPDGPSPEGPVAKLRSWWVTNQTYLFFSDAGGYRWYLDPLAKARGVPSAQLRGPSRATAAATRNGSGSAPHRTGR